MCFRTDESKRTKSNCLWQQIILGMVELLRICSIAESKAACHNSQIMTAEVSLQPQHSEQAVLDAYELEIQHEPAKAETDFYARIQLDEEPGSNSEQSDSIKIVSDTAIEVNGEIIELSGDKLFIFNALLNFKGKPARAEEIRRLGFREGSSAAHTRMRFALSMRHLRQDLDSLGDRPMVQVSGATRGTRYSLDSAVSVKDGRMQALLIGEKPSYLERENVVTKLVQEYGQARYVETEIDRFREPTSGGMRLSQDSVSDYFQLASGYRLLTKQDEVVLFGQIENGLRTYANLNNQHLITPEQEKSLMDLVAARQIIYVTNLRLAIKMSNPYRRNRGQLEQLDIIQEANDGLAKAIPRMDITKGYKFSTYATWWIKQGVARAIASTSREIRIPVHVHERYIKTKRKVQLLESALNREPTMEEIEAEAGISYTQYTELMSNGREYLTSLNHFVDAAGETELGSLLPDRVAEPENANFERVDEVKSILATAPLTDTERVILGLRLGLSAEYFPDVSITTKSKKHYTYAELQASIGDGNQTGQKLIDIGKIFNLSAERVRQLERAALIKLRDFASK
jgi:RNA polymerase sigma factor (sigma-70 family)